MDLKRLCHISDLPNNLYYLPIEIKHLLPIHHTKLSENVFTILHNESNNFKCKIFPDQHLVIQCDTYDDISGGWCEDIDGKPNHLKSSLELAAIALNYISSACNQMMNAQENEYIPMISNVVVRQEHVFEDDSAKRQSPFNFQCPLSIAYNFYKYKAGEESKYIFLIGRNRSSQKRYYTLINTIRKWNLSRLRANDCCDVPISRSNKLLEHLVSILRGLMQFEQEDLNNEKKQLQNILKQLPENDMPLAIPRHFLDKSNILILSRYEFSYKNQIDQKKLNQLMASALITIISLIPKNTQCSYASRLIDKPKINQFTIFWLTCYRKIPNGGKIKHIGKQNINKSNDKAVQFMKKNVIESIKDHSKNIADQLFKSSISVFNRFHEISKPQKNKFIYPYPSKNKFDSLDESFISQRRLDRSDINDKLSQKDKLSLKERSLIKSNSGLKNKSFKDLQSQLISDNFQSMTSPLMAYRDKQYSQIMNSIEDEQFKSAGIYNSTEMRFHLLKNCQKARQKYENTNFDENQNELLLALSGLPFYLQESEITQMLQNHEQSRETLFEIFFQKNNSNYMYDIGKRISKENIQKQYKDYLTRNLVVNKYSLLVKFLKRYLLAYNKTLGTLKPTLSQKISVPTLLEILESKNYHTEKYKKFLVLLLNDIFYESEHLKMISPFLYQCYIKLAEDHHEQLINGLIGNLAYEIIHFSYDTSQINNTPYVKEMNLKQKKLTEVLREGGFSKAGFELKNILKPIIFKYKDYQLPEGKIYYEICIHKPILINKFIILLSNSRFTQHFVQINKYFEQSFSELKNVNQVLSNIYFRDEVKRVSYKPINKDQKISINNLKSQSGIFNHLLAYNPQIKIAGMSLSKVIENHQTRKKNKSNQQKFDVQVVLKDVLQINIEEVYEFIRIVQNMKQKYLKYESLGEEQKIYFRQIVHQVLCRKSQIYQYLELNNLIKSYLKLEFQHLF